MTGTPSSRATRRATGSRCCGRRCARCSDRYATWDIGNLAAAIADEQVRTPAVTEAPQDLAAEVLREGDRYGVVMLSVRDVGTVPAELRRPDGLSRYRMRNAAEYATTAQLATEATIVERARGTGAAALAGPALELARVELQAAGLGDDQQAAVLQILSSGRRGDVLIGPAGRREVPHGRRAGPGVGAADRRPGPRRGDLEHRHAGPHRGRAHRAEHQAVPAPVRTRRAGPGA